MRLKESYSVPEVGPFFIVPLKSLKNKEMLLADTVEVSEADDFGDFKTTDKSHYDYWHKLQKTYPELRYVDYDYYPRGRVTYNKKEDRYYLFLDSCINSQKYIDMVVDELGIPFNKVEIKKDEHYQCHNCDEDYLDIFENVEN